jgi:hypothetical protein
LQGEEHPARGAAQCAALSGHVSAGAAGADGLRFAGKTCARLTGSEVPSTPDTETSFEQLQQRIAKAVDYVKSFKPAQFDGGDERDVTFPIGPNNTMTMKGRQYLVNFAFPNFYFHAATAHGILRHNGVEIGKRDFLGVR